ncbi:MAG: glycosyltransferase [Spirochaetaceae bacterium]|nr:glycosyltransferase [Spirochaetaceae bacterium]
MRILQVVTRSEAGGAQSVVATLAGELASRGYESAIASGPEGDGEAWRDAGQSIRLFGLPSLRRAISPFWDIRALGELSRLYRDYKPDIVHLHTSKAAALGRLAVGVDRGRIVYTMHGYDQLRVRNRKLLAVDKALRDATGAIVAVSRLDQETMRGDGYATLYAANGVPDTLLLRPRDAAIADRLTGLRRRGSPLGLVVARDAPPKRIDLARAAARALPKKATIAWIGGEPATGDPENFVALGAAPGAASYLSLVDFFLLPSDGEGMPMSVLEAFSAGLPVVASAVGGVPEVLGVSGAGDGPRGFAVPNEAEAFRAAIARVAGDSELRTRMGRAGRAAWEADYSAAAMTERYLEVYGDLMVKKQ